MVDTVKSLSALQTLLADNAAGDISPQDLRDFLVTSLMETNVQSVTTSDITGAIGQSYEFDLSGLTAERSFTLPVASVGDEIRVIVIAGDADYELVIKGVATVTINGGAEATEWSRLFIDNETVTLRATSSTNWQIINDGRISSGGKLYRSTTQTITSGVHTQIELTSIDYVKGMIADITTTWSLKVRRAGRYKVDLLFSHDAAATSTIGVGINADTDNNNYPVGYQYDDRAASKMVNFNAEFAVGDLVKLWTYSFASGNTRASNHYNYPNMELTEKL